MARAFTTVDLFSGCGGFSLGAELAGFHSLAAIDIDSTLQSGYKKNFPRTKAIQASVADLDSAAWTTLLGKVRPDAVLGGPPCQGFSRMGKREKTDPRNSLIGHFYRQVSLLRPKFFIMENVEGILDGDNADILKESIATVSKWYNVLEPIVINASDFGAATKRKRVVVIGYDPKEMDKFDSSLFASPSNDPTTVQDAISDLSQPVRGDEDYGWGKYKITDGRKVSKYAKYLRAKPPEGLGWKEAIEHLRAGLVSGFHHTEHTKEIAERYKNIETGKSDPISKSYKLGWMGQCPTLRAGTGSDKGSFQAVRPIHPASGRVITVREAARMQGFPDWFVFHTTKWHSFRMIGNSVSPFVSKGLLSRIGERIS